MRRLIATSGLLLSALAASLGVRAAEPHAQAPDPKFAAAAELYRTGKWQAAMRTFDAYEGSHVDAAQLYAAECCSQLGDYGAAQERLKKIVARGDAVTEPYRSQALFRAGEAAWKLGDADEGRRLLEQFVASSGDATAAPFAYDYLDQIATQGEQPPANPRIAWRQLADEALAHEHAGRHDAALAAFREAAAAAPPGAHKAWVLWTTGELHRRLDQFDEAASAYEQAVAQDPHGHLAPIARLAAGRAHKRHGDAGAFAQSLRTLIDESPDSVEAREAAYELALDAFEKRELATARKELAWLAKHAGDESRRSAALRNRARLLTGQLEVEAEHWSAAVAPLDMVIADRKAESELRLSAMFWRAEIEYRRQRFPAALDRFQRLSAALDRNKDEPTAREAWTDMVPVRIAQIYAHDQQWTEVLALVNELHGADVDAAIAPELDYLEGRSRAGRGEMKAARTAYQRVIDNPQTAGSEAAARAQWMIGETYFHQRNLAAAQDAYLSVVHNYEQPAWQARAALQAGKCMELSGDWAGARKLYAESADQFSTADAASQLRARAAWIARTGKDASLDAARDAQTPAATRRK